MVDFAGSQHRFADQVVADRERWALWLPVALGSGVAAYFALPIEPRPWAGAVLTLLAAAFLTFGRPRPGPRMVIFALVAASLGFTAAQVRTANVDTPILSDEIGPVRLVGTVVATEELPANAIRAVIGEPTIEDVAPEHTPRRVRIRLNPADRPAIGARIDVLAVLKGPSGPAEPGAFDFRRWAFYREIGAVGFALGRIRPMDDPPDTRFALRLERTRTAIAQRIDRAIDDEQASAIAVALLTGKRGGISEATYGSLRDAGLAHLLAISGLHLGLVAGIVFFSVRLVLASSETLALRWPIKKWAAGTAMIASFAYMVVVGATIPTQRAFLMTGIVLLAVMVDRTAISMRLVAWAAAVVLILRPDSLTGASFQMSFAAVIALVAAYEIVSPRLAATDGSIGPGWVRGPALYLGGVGLSTVIATAATAPFALFHFQRLATYGVISNLVAVPLTAFCIMPSGLVAYLLMPLGLEALPLTVMAWGIKSLLALAQAASAWPGAALLVPAIPTWGLAMAVGGGLWLCLWRQPIRLIGIVAILIGLAGVFAVQRPDILADGRGRLMAVRLPDRALSVSTLRANRFEREIWLRRNGQVDAQTWVDAGADAGGALVCDGLGCLYRRNGWMVALVRDPMALADDCIEADALVAAVPVPRGCGAGVVVDRFDLWRYGPHVLYLHGDGITVRNVAEDVGARPWAVARPDRGTRGAEEDQ